MISSVSGGVNSRSCMKRAGNKRAREDSDRETIFLSSFSLSEHVRAASCESTTF